jgi:hypothetical protein
VAIVQENIDFSIYQARADEELDAACRSTQPEETELHLRLALLHLQQQRDARFFTNSVPAPNPDQRRRAIYHTDKEG